MNVAQLRDFADRDQFLAHATNLPRVILEGRSDVELFKSWFEHLQAEFDFLAAEDLGQGAGCTAVRPAVQFSLSQQVPAIGIVDRDYLHRHKRWDLLFATKASVEHPTDHPDVQVATRWEIEAYLLEPSLLGMWVGVQRKPQPAPESEARSALTRALEECEALLNAAAFFASGHATEKSYDVRHFKEDDADRVADVCRSKLEAESEERKRVAAEVEAYVAAVRADAPSDPAERFVYLLRYVDTKRLLHRLGARLKLGEEAHHALRYLMSDKKLRPKELEQFLELAAKRFEEMSA